MRCPRFAGVSRALLLALFVFGRARAAIAVDPLPPECDQPTREALLSEPTPGNESVMLACSVTLDRGDYVIKKKIVIAGASASGVTLDCNGAMIDPGDPNDVLVIRSVPGASTWSAPHDVTIRNCVIKGAMRVYGMARNANAQAVRESSFSVGHTERAQAAAPKGVALENVHFVTDGVIALYVGPGVTGLTLSDSEISGTTKSVSIYLDAESAGHRIEGNSIHAVTESREQIAIDGSADNVIQGNHFSGLQNGGIYLYRNCGENGTVRHQTPHGNYIADNYFYYDRYRGRDPAVWIASRNGDRDYCSEDAGYPFGSSASNRDYARDNIVENNQIRERSAERMIRVDDQPNTVRNNVTVKPRAIGCGSRPSSVEPIDVIGLLF